MSDKINFFARDLLENGEAFVLAEVVDTTGSTPRKKGARLLMRQDGTTEGTVGGGRLEAETEKLCRETLKTKEEKKIYHFKLNTEEPDALNMGCGGDADVMIQYIDAAHPEAFTEEFGQTTAYIFGAGHVGLALEPVLRHIDFRTVVIDDRDEYANRERFPQAAEVRVPADFQHAFAGLKIGKNDYIVIVTRGHMGDYDVLKDALRQDCAYIGMIGSRKKDALLYDMLRKNDGYTDEDLARVHAPIGLAIQAETPEEIAISIAAEMIQVRAGRD